MVVIILAESGLEETVTSGTALDQLSGTLDRSSASSQVQDCFGALTEDYFRVDFIPVNAEHATVRCGMAIIVAWNDESILQSMDRSEMVLRRGQVALAPAAASPLTITGRGELFVCSNGTETNIRRENSGRGN